MHKILSALLAVGLVISLSAIAGTKKKKYKTKKQTHSKVVAVKKETSKKNKAKKKTKNDYDLES